LTEEQKNQFITWSWIAGIVITVLIAVGGYLLTDTRADIKALKQEKLDKEDYYRDINSVKDGINRLIDMHMNKRK